ncbi:hypothetical protein M406DRAFT_104008 [Cryphonectria parasitica EP155]|uniref:Uncharacterized protein n=1 Tax=Cryphonectria parasitica (strain ATCC 38755 / EP155) TaxID=660469 RepID=A0A9P5CK06_CRYP1|nr:uncharacterized protein M406DRAFT_104008 [Cryphonectria parasitica EP155]KAF3761553.1 hypothetical protein M406DRAFT_104008 [Cryphonectria parasitica EP155]
MQMSGGIESKHSPILASTIAAITTATTCSSAFASLEERWLLTCIRLKLALLLSARMLHKLTP